MALCSELFPGRACCSRLGLHGGRGVRRSVRNCFREGVRKGVCNCIRRGVRTCSGASAPPRRSPGAHYSILTKNDTKSKKALNQLKSVICIYIYPYNIFLYMYIYIYICISLSLYIYISVYLYIYIFFVISIYLYLYSEKNISCTYIPLKES